MLLMAKLAGWKKFDFKNRVSMKFSFLKKKNEANNYLLAMLGFKKKVSTINASPTMTLFLIEEKKNSLF